MKIYENKKITILVSGASGIVGYGILKSLQGYGYKLIGTTIYEESAANCFSDITLKAPKTTSDEYIPWLIKKIQDFQIDAIFPGIETDMNVWNQNRELISRTGVVIILNNTTLINTCLDKWEFYKILERNNIACRIKTTDQPMFSAFKLPFVIKPKCGYASQGFMVIHNREEYEQNKEKIGKTHIMQEMVGSNEQEYTIAAFFDKKSNLKAMISFRRKLSRLGYTEFAEVVELDGMEQILNSLAKILKPIGPTDFQFRLQNEEWKLLEVNPRISSSTSIRTAFGYNEAEMAIEYFVLGHEIRQPLIKKGKAIRYVEDYIIK